jgi:hypothetical protein
MAKTLQFKRYTTEVLANTIGSNGELIVDSNTSSITVHDGITPGGRYAANAITLQSVIIQTNSAFTIANTTSNVANSAAIYANGAFAAANAAATIIPQNLKTTNYVLQLSDAGKYIYYNQSNNTILYIPTTSNVAFSNGTTIMIISKTTSSANVTVSPNTGVSLYLAGNTTSVSRNVTTYGVATLMQVEANTWFIQGTGIL